MKFDFIPRDIESVVDFFLKPKELSSPTIEVIPSIPEPVITISKAFGAAGSVARSTAMKSILFVNLPLGFALGEKVTKGTKH
ncbi:hypothetical protein HNY73_021952 [Argiope bruennichi]|uniref:Uncharacterized protein n=1 Tax=Argiope bruennichi TaxID=94029 RepID=A0A8T0E044_ARGBR|nr:hypothetical protein HNY73_021952 [Argiope bruennichi]